MFKSALPRYLVLRGDFNLFIAIVATHPKHLPYGKQALNEIMIMRNNGSEW